MFNCFLIPFLTWSWFSGSSRIYRRLIKQPQGKMTHRIFLFWIFQIVAAYPSVLFIFSAYRWLVPIFLIAWGWHIWCCRIKRTDANVPWFIFIISLLSLYLWAFPGLHHPFTIDFYHEGDQLGLARDFLHGKIPFRDIFIDQGVLFNIWKPALAFRLWGETIVAKRFMDAICTPLPYLSLACLIWMTMRRTIPALLMPFFIFLMFPGVSDRTFIAYLFLSATIAGVRAESSMTKQKWLGIAGILLAVQFFYSMEVGLFCAAGFFLATLVLAVADHSYGKNLTPVAIGFLIVFLPFSLYLAFHGALDDYLWNTVMRLSTHSFIEGIPFHILRIDPIVYKTGASLPGLLNDRNLIHYLPLFIHYGALAWLFLHRRQLDHQTKFIGWLLTLSAVFFYYPALCHADGEHINFSIPLSILLAAWVLQSVETANVNHRPNFKSVVILSSQLLMIVYAFRVFALPERFFTRPRQIIDNIRSTDLGLLGQSDPLDLTDIPDDLNGLAHAIDEHSSISEPLVNLTNDGALFFTAHRRNLTRYYLGEILYTQAMEDEVLYQMQTTPSFLVVTPRSMAITNRSGRPYLELSRFITNECESIWSNSRYLLWRKG